MGSEGYEEIFSELRTSSENRTRSESLKETVLKFSVKSGEEMLSKCRSV
jgi:hypothetical protein